MLLAGLVLLSDALALGLAFLLVRGAAQVLNDVPATTMGSLFLAAGLAALALGAWHDAYSRRELLRARSGQMSPLLPAAAIGWMLMVVSTVAVGGMRPSPTWTAVLAIVSLGLLAAGRAAVTGALEGPVGDRFAPSVLIIGGETVGLQTVAGHLRGHAAREGLHLLGAVSDDPDAAEALRSAGVPYLGGIENAVSALRNGQVEQVILLADWVMSRSAASILRRLADAPIEFYLATDIGGDVRTSSHRIKVLRLQEAPITGSRAVVKSVADFAFALVAIVLAAAPMLLITLAIRLESPGPVLFRQCRTGFRGREFRILKFRTMYHHATDADARRQVMAGDDRLTKVGAILRRTSLDELPQLFNILAGDMSFVGPRPHAPETRAGGRRFDEVTTHYAARHRVKPGLTGLAQVRGWRGSTETEEKLLRRLECDLEYIENWSLSLDLTIIARTLVAVASMKNAH
jgi:Undecaprenyl-phosphate glucose phosphotransferase